MPHPSVALAALLALSVAAPASAQQIIPQQFPGAQGRYEMCIKRHVIELRRVRGKSMEPLDELASGQVACKRQRPKDGEDVIATLMECGVARGDGTPDQGCPQ